MSELQSPPQGRKTKIAVLDDYMGVAHKLADWNQLTDRAAVEFLREPIAGPETLQPYDAICLLRERTATPGDLLRSLPNLKAIAATGRQNRTLDHETAAELGIAVMTTTGSGNGVYATVELAWGLIISLMRHIPQESQAMRDGDWQTRLGSALYGRTLGLVGLGKLGSRMAHLASAFGMDVIAWSPNLTEERARDGGARLVDKQTLLSSADIVSLHLVLGPTTRGIIGREDIAQMRSDAILINTARGPLIDEDALIEALKANAIRAAAIDVYDAEPLPRDHPLRSLPNALLTPHLGYSVRETFERFYIETVENLDGWLNGTPPRLLTAKKG